MFLKLPNVFLLLYSLSYSETTYAKSSKLKLEIILESWFSLNIQSYNQSVPLTLFLSSLQIIYLFSSQT